MTTKLNVIDLCTAELLAIFRIPKQTFYGWKRKKLLPKPRRVNGKSLYNVKQFVAAIRNNRLNVDPVAMELLESQFATETEDPKP